MQEYWSSLPFPSPGEIKPMSFVFPALAGRFFTTEPRGESTCPTALQEKKKRFTVITLVSITVRQWSNALRILEVALLCSLNLISTPKEFRELMIWEAPQNHRWKLVDIYFSFLVLEWDNSEPDFMYILRSAQWDWVLVALSRNLLTNHLYLLLSLLCLISPWSHQCLQESLP